MNDELALPAPVSRTFGAPDAIWPTDNVLQIPALVPEMQAEAVYQPVSIWGEVKRKSQMPGTWSFYPSDDRFEALWKRPDDVVRTGAVAAFEPNVSVYENMPLPVALWGIYRKRWMARYWQQQGIRVFVDLNVAAPYAEANLAGVPRGWRAYATRGYTERLADTHREYRLALERADGAGPVLFVVYGGGDTVAHECMRMGWYWMPETMSRRRPNVMALAAAFNGRPALAAPPSNGATLLTACDPRVSYGEEDNYGKG